MSTIPRLSRNVRRRILRESRRCTDVALAIRYRAIAKLGAGTSTVTAARELEVARSTVVRAAERFRKGGLKGLADRRVRNGARKTDGPFKARVEALLARSPQHFGWNRPTWTRELLCLQMQSERWPRVAVCTMGRVLRRVGARRGMPKPVVLCPWPRSRRLERLAELRELEQRASAAEPVLYVDEVDIHLNPKIGRDWMLPGKQRWVRTPGKNQKFYVAGALDVRTGWILSTGASRKTSALFCDLLDTVGKHFRRAKRVHLILDNYGIHSAAPAKEALKRWRGKLVLHFLPPYCPDANRIERVWLDLHANVTRNHRCRTMPELLHKTRSFLEGYVWRRAARASAQL